LRIAVFLQCVALLMGLCLKAHGESNDAERFIVVPGCRISFADSVQLASERKGILASALKPGAEVAAGGNVAQLRDSVVRATMAIAEREAENDIELRFAQKAAELSQIKFERASAADAQIAGTVSELEMKELRLAAERGALQCQQAEHRLAVARLRREEMSATLDSLRLVAPFNATVRAVFKRPGEVVQEGEIVAEIVNTQRIRVEGDLPLEELPSLALHSQVIIRIDAASAPANLAEQSFSGAVEFIDVKVEPVSHKVRVAAELDNRSGLLREGLTATMFIHRSNAVARKP
jgi:membrane fusion protein, multidrug efflux system